MTAALPASSDLHRPNRFEIDLGAIAHNLAQIRRLVGPGVRIITALKANAYGFGLLPVARTVVDGGTDLIAVADIADASALRAAGIELPILLYAAQVMDAGTVAAVEHYRLMPTVFDVASVEMLASKARRPIRVFVKIDVGLERLGVVPGRALEVVERILERTNVMLHGLYTHVDVPESPRAGEYVRWQLERYADVVAALVARGIDIPVRMAASSAVLRGTQDAHFDAVDPGHLLFGLTPPGPVEVALDLAPAFVSLTSRLIHVRAVERTEFRDLASIPLAEDLRFGVLPIGLRDGIASLTCGEVLIRGRRAPIIGAFSLEHTRIDLTEVADAEIGDEVVIIGRQGAAAIEPRSVLEHQGLGLEAALALAVRESVPRVYRDGDDLTS